MTIDMSGRRLLIRFSAMLLAATLASIAPSLADQVVYFVNGKAIMVKSVEAQGVLTFLEMEGGGRMGVPTEQIARITEYELSAPVVPAPPVAAQIPVPVAATPGQMAAAPAASHPPLATQPSFASVTPAPTGPGFAGQPSTLAPLNPVNSAGPAVGGPAGGALAGPGGPYRPGLGAQGRRFGKGVGPAGRMQRGMGQGGFRNRPPAAQATPTADPPEARPDAEPADPGQNPADPDAAPDPGDGQADQGDTGS